MRITCKDKCLTVSSILVSQLNWRINFGACKIEYKISLTILGKNLNLIYFNIFFESSWVHRTDCKQLDKVTTKKVVLVLDGIGEPHVEEVPTLLGQEALEQLLIA